MYTTVVYSCIVLLYITVPRCILTPPSQALGPSLSNPLLHPGSPVLPGSTYIIDFYYPDCRVFLLFQVHFASHRFASAVSYYILGYVSPGFAT
jgi:hypothetical protein